MSGYAIHVSVLNCSSKPCKEPMWFRFGWNVFTLEKKADVKSAAFVHLNNLRKATENIVSNASKSGEVHENLSFFVHIIAIGIGNIFKNHQS